MAPSFAVAVATGLLFGLAPAWQAPHIPLPGDIPDSLQLDVSQLETGLHFLPDDRAVVELELELVVLLGRPARRALHAVGLGEHGCEVEAVGLPVRDRAAGVIARKVEAST